MVGVVSHRGRTSSTTTTRRQPPPPLVCDMIYEGPLTLKKIPHQRSSGYERLFVDLPHCTLVANRKTDTQTDDVFKLLMNVAHHEAPLM